MPESIVTILTGAGVAGAFCIAFMVGWLYPKPFVDDLKAERDAWKAAAAAERERAEAAVAAAQASRDVMAALQAGITLAQQGHGGTARGSSTP